jgi:hypothetical protein
MEELDGLIGQIKHINVKKTEEKVVKYLAGFIFGIFFFSMATKFVNDNWSFRIPKISNLPEEDAKTTN